MTKIAEDWPGKSNALGARHPALWHMLDVAAVAKVLVPLGPLHPLRPEWQQALLFLVALHDCGKISMTFRDQIDRGTAPSTHNRHWQLSFRILKTHDALIGNLLGGDATARALLYAAVSGHHGRPPSPHRDHDIAVGHEGFAAAAEAIRSIAALFPSASLEGIDETTAVRLSWLLSGTTVEADWIGSNEEWFPFASPHLSVREYWAAACRNAVMAVSSAGLSGSRPAKADPARIVGRPLRPMQQAAAYLSLPDGPTLAVIEDATGAGKTEAALILAQRMLAAGKGRGIYFALPTMASAEAMFERMRPMILRFFEGAPSLALLHGRRQLSDAFRTVRGNTGSNPNDAGCAAWIADDRRRSLLADIGVGTIDQALMGVLPTRFNTLRMTALADRVLIVDEAHSYDPYMETELQTLLRFHAGFGGSAILMTATLPTAMRQKFVQAWVKKDRRTRGRVEIPTLSDAYPAFSLIGATSLSLPIDPVPATCRRLAIDFVPDAAAAVAVIVDGQARGAACLWVRNAVDDAIAAVDALRAAGVEAELLHARFATCDRLEVERHLAERFGPRGVGRAGRVLVATQVVEMSLDLDFDLMVSDLAPIGSLIQRAGRLWRHMDVRPAETRPVPGPTLHLLSPDPDTAVDDRWLHDVLDAGAWIYPHDEQWLTARALKDAGAIVAPDGLRGLISSVHGEGAPTIPEPLLRAETDRIGKQAAQRGQARQHLLEPGRAYGFEENVFNDQVFPTRLGEEQMTLVLTRKDASGTLVPWSQDPDRFHALALSEVQLALRKYRPLALSDLQATPEIGVFTAGWKDWERATKAVAVVAEDGAICEGLRYERDRGLIFASSVLRQ